MAFLSAGILIVKSCYTEILSSLQEGVGVGALTMVAEACDNVAGPVPIAAMLGRRVAAWLSMSLTRSQKYGSGSSITPRHGQSFSSPCRFISGRCCGTLGNLQ
jgi:hypothetical protein